MKKTYGIFGIMIKNEQDRLGDFMKLQKNIEEEIKKYTEARNYKIQEKLLWNEGGIVYSIISTKGIRKSLFVTSLEGDKTILKEVYCRIVADSNKQENPLIQCQSIECKEITDQKGNIGYYIFIVMEEVRPVVQVVLEEEFCDNELNTNQKSMKLLKVIEDACSCVEFVHEKYPDINIFINNEELCIDNEGNAKLLLFDIIKNEICIDNQVKELKIIMKQLANVLGVKLNICCEDDKISSLKSACMEAFERREKAENKYVEKFKKNMELAQRGDIRACYNLGHMYDKGKGTSVNYTEAISWYEKAASKKHVKALNNLAYIYQKGNGVEKDYNRAMEYLLRAAKLNDNMAQFNLAIMYQTGKGVDKDMKKALYWYKKSMKNGNLVAKRMYKRVKAYENN